MNSTRMTLILADLRGFKNRVARAFEARSNSATEKNKKGIIIFPILTFCFSPSFLVFWFLSRFYHFLSAIIRPIRVIRVLFALLLCCIALQPARADVIPGIDILASRNFDLLQGKQVGLITNGDQLVLGHFRLGDITMPSLTALSTDYTAQGRLAINRMARLLQEGTASPPDVWLPLPFHPRASTALNYPNPTAPAAV